MTSLPNMPIMCMVCMATVKEADFPAHMNLHGGSQAVAKAKEQNLPKQAPIVLDPNAPPSDEFMEIAKMMDQPKPTQTPPAPRTEAPAPVPPFSQEVKKKPLKLAYKWEGQCLTCGNSVKTIVVENHAIAYCLTCDEEVKQLEVHPIEKDKPIERVKEEITIREVGENHVKRRKFKLAKNKPKISSTYEETNRDASGKTLTYEGEAS